MLDRIIHRLLVSLFALGLGGAALLCMLIGGIILFLTPQLPDVKTLKDVRLQTPLRIYSHEGELLGEFGDKRRHPIAYQDIPPAFIHAILAAEDANFFEHNGVDLKGLGRAFKELATTGRKQSGGSTITMQVARNFFLTNHRTFIRKFNEILLALQIEHALTKEEILNLYVNKIYLGHRAYGIEAAARVYYGKSIHELDLAQLAMIAGLPKAPSRYNPISNAERAAIRRNWILSRLYELGFIDKSSLETALQAPISAQYHEPAQTVFAPYMTEWVRQTLVAKYGTAVYEDGYLVTTTLDQKLQRYAQNSVYGGLQEYDQRHGYRGAEQQQTLPDTDTSPDTLTEPSDTNRQLAQKMLSQKFVIGPMIPAVVMDITADRALLLLNSNRTVELTWDNMAWARNVVAADGTQTRATLVKDIIKPGDLIRIVFKDPQQDPKNQADAKHSQATVVTPANIAPASTEKIVTLSQLPDAQVALVAIDPMDGAVRAMVGGLDFRLSKFNRATQAGRQVGSGLKPFIYAAALQYGLTPATIINDAPLVFSEPGMDSVWRPGNAEGKFNGPTRLRQALYQSRNLVSIRVLQRIGIKRARNYLERLGFDRNKLPNNLSLALGTPSLTPLEIAQEYAVLANQGFLVKAYGIEKIVRYDGVIVEANSAPRACPGCEASVAATAAATTGTTVITAAASTTDNDIADTETDEADVGEDPVTSTDAAVASAPSPVSQTLMAPRVMEADTHYLLHTMLQDVITKGTGRRALELKRRDIAGKTGTTNDQKDAWFSGYNRHLTATVWMGFDQPESLGANEYGGTAALPIWIDFMHEALAGVPETQFDPPANIVNVKIDPETGMRVRGTQPGAIFEVFKNNRVPGFQESRPATDPANGNNGSPTPLQNIF
jgi:penicillin-binding protein 1A